MIYDDRYCWQIDWPVIIQLIEKLKTNDYHWFVLVCRCADALDDVSVVLSDTMSNHFTKVDHCFRVLENVSDFSLALDL